MELRSLELFLHLSDTLHFGQTSESMHVSPSTLSRTIKRLEDEAGLALFERDNRSVSLTRAGEAFALFAEKTLVNWQRFQQITLPKPDELVGNLSVFCSVTASYSYLPHVLSQLRDQHPKVDIKVATGDASLAILKVSKGEVDIAISAKPDMIPRNMAFSSFGQMPISLIGPKTECALSQQLKVLRPKWRSLPYIVADSGLTKGRSEHWFDAMNINPNIYATVSGHEAIVAMVSLGLGIGLAPDIVIENSPVRDRVQKLDSGVEIAPFELGVCCLNQRLTDPLVNAFWQLAESL